MTSDTESAPEMQSKASTLLQWVTVAVGIVSLLVLSRDGFSIQLQGFVDAVATAYDDILKDIALATLEPFIASVLAVVRERWNISLQLYPHWKHAYVLLWLFLGSSIQVYMRAAPASFWEKATAYLVGGGLCAHRWDFRWARSAIGSRRLLVANMDANPARFCRRSR